MNIQQYTVDIDPEATEGNGSHASYDPRCSRSVEQAAERLRQELGLDYTPVVAFCSPPFWRRWLSRR